MTTETAYRRARREPRPPVAHHLNTRSRCARVSRPVHSVAVLRKFQSWGSTAGGRETAAEQLVGLTYPGSGWTAGPAVNHQRHRSGRRARRSRHDQCNIPAVARTHARAVSSRAISTHRLSRRGSPCTVCVSLRITSKGCPLASANVRRRSERIPASLKSTQTGTGSALRTKT